MSSDLDKKNLPSICVHCLRVVQFTDNCMCVLPVSVSKFHCFSTVAGLQKKTKHVDGTFYNRT